MSYIENSLSEGEHIVDMFDLHWVVWIEVFVWVLIGIATAGILLPVALYKFLKYHYIEYGLTNKRLIYKHGIISRNTEEIKLNAIETVELRQSIWGRIFNMGTVKATGRGVSNLHLKRIDDPINVKKSIDKGENS